MRTTLEIDDALLDALLARHPGVSEREAVETAIRAYLARDAANRLRALRGTATVHDSPRALPRDRES